LFIRFRPYFPLVFVLLLAAGLRMYELGRNPLWYDEVLCAGWCKTFNAEIASSRTLRMEPAYYVLLWAWEKAGRSEAWLRTHAVVAGVATTALAFAMGRRIAGSRGALIGGLLTAGAPMLVFYARDAKMYAWVALLALLAVYSALRYAEPDGRVRHLAAYGISAVLLVHMHELAAFFLAELNVLYALFFFRSRKKALVWCLIQVLVAAACMPYLMTLVRAAGSRRDMLFWAPVPTWRSLWFAVCNQLMAYSTVEWMRAVAVGITVLFVAAGVLLRHPHRKWVAFLCLLGATNILVLFCLSIWGSWSLFVDRYLIASAPMFVMAAAPGLALIRPRALGTAGVAALLAVCACALGDVYEYRLPVDRLKHGGVYRSVDSRRIGQAMREHAQPGDAAWYASWEVPTTVRWYAPGLPHHIVEFNGEQSQSIARLATPTELAYFNLQFTPIETAQAEARRVWFVLPEDYPEMYAQWYGVKAWLDARAHPIYQEQLGGRYADASMSLYDLADVPRAGAHGPRPVPPSACSITLVGRRQDGNEGRTGAIEASLSKDLQLTIRNDSELARQVYWQAFKGDHVYDAAGFDRIRENASRWGLQIFRDVGSARMAFYGRFSTRGHIDDPLEYPGLLDPGIYDVFVERQVNSRPGGSAAPFRIRAGNAACEMTGTFSDLPEGWRWVHAGQVRLDEKADTVAVEPYRSTPGVEISPVFSRVVFVESRAAATNQPASPVTADGICHLAPNETKTIQLDVSPHCSRIGVGLALDEACMTISAEAPGHGSTDNPR